MRILGLICALALLPISHAAQAQQAPRVRVQTNLGAFVIELDPERAPLSVSNFLDYVRSGHYEGTIFHRVIANFVAQGGGYDEKFVEKPTHAAVPNESGNGLSNVRGTVGMARTAEPHSGTSQFYINLADNLSLDPKPSRWGYAVFGRIVEGMNVVDQIGAVATGQVGPFERDAPMKNVVIQKVEELGTPGAKPNAPNVAAPTQR
ncbi:MAG TPA: peptidylprolyl isomerase [Steroidobacteraceae bacterium]|nr:peptidylprolyl isomerase [Steroidobacteraceae bacterium]